MSSTKTNPDTEILQSGIAVLAETNNTFDDNSTWKVHGIALSEGAITFGGSQTRRYWPADTLRRAAPLLEDRHIVKNYHEREGAANADEIIGRVTRTDYQEGVGILFEGEVLDEDIARKIDNGFLDVSVVAGISEEHYNESRDAVEVDAIAGFRDIAVVGDGADESAEIQMGEHPAIAALSRATFSGSWDALQETTVSEPNWEGYSTAEWSAPSLDGTFGGDMDAARNSATFIRDGGESFGDLSLFVVNGDRQLNLNGLDSAWLMASQTDDVSSDEVSRLRGMYESMAETARNAGALGDSAWEETWQPRIEGEAESNAANQNADTITEAARRMTVPAESLQEDGEDGDSGDTRLDVWSDFLADMSGSVSVDEVNFDNLHRLLASEIPGADISDVAGALPAEDFDEGFGAADARELISGLANQDSDEDSDDESESGESESDGGDEDEDEDEEDTESNADWAYQPESAVGALMMRDLELTGTTPNRCQTIKDGASSVDTENNDLARSILGLDDEDQTDLTRASAGDDPVAQQAADLSDPTEDDEPDPSVKNTGDQDFARTDVVDGEDPIGRELFGMPDPSEDDDEPDPTIKDVDRDRDYSGDEVVDGEDPVGRELFGMPDPAEDDDEPDPTIKNVDRDRDYSGDGLVNADDPIDREFFGMPDPAEDDDEPDPTIKNKESDGRDLSEAVIGEDADVVDREYVTSPDGDDSGEDEEEVEAD